MMDEMFTTDVRYNGNINMKIPSPLSPVVSFRQADEAQLAKKLSIRKKSLSSASVLSSCGNVTQLKNVLSNYSVSSHNSTDESNEQKELIENGCNEPLTGDSNCFDGTNEEMEMSTDFQNGSNGNESQNIADVNNVANDRNVAGYENIANDKNIPDDNVAEDKNVTCDNNGNNSNVEQAEADAMEVDNADNAPVIDNGNIWDGPAPIEILISFDTTGSMSYFLDEIKGKIQEMIQRLFMDMPNLKMGVIAHGDYCDENVFYLMQSCDLTNDPNSLCDFVKGVEGTGGGDFEECYELVLNRARKWNWSPGTQRSLIMIGDAIPHNPDYELNKDGLNWRDEADLLLTETGVHVYAVQCQNEKGADVFWKELSERTSGNYLKMAEFSTIVDLLMAICYREHGPGFFNAYEREVRHREGHNMRKELGAVFQSLRGGDSYEDDIGDNGEDSVPSTSRVTTSRVTKKPKVNTKSRGATTSKPAGRRTIKTARTVSKETQKSPKALTLEKRKVLKQETKKFRSAKQKNEKTTPKKFRETKALKEFQELKWSPWRLAMGPTPPAGVEDLWIPRRNSEPGFRKKTLFHRGNDRAAFYEFAVKTPDSVRRVPVYATITKGFTKSRWDTNILNNKCVRQQIDNVFSQNCFIFVRKAYIPKNRKLNDHGYTSLRELRTAWFKTYDYAWSDRRPGKILRNLKKCGLTISDNTL